MVEVQRPTTLRERRKQQTRDLIRRIAVNLVKDRGFNDVTVDLICDHAGVSPRTFFNYFPSKESAMVAVPPPLTAAAIARFLARSGADGLFADLAELAISQLDDGEIAPTDFEDSMQVVLGTPALATMQYGVFAELESQFAELIATRLGVDPDSTQPAVLAAVFMSAVRVAGQRCARHPERRSLAHEVRACLSILSTDHPPRVAPLPEERDTLDE